MKRGERSTKLFEKALRELERLLRRAPATARQIADRFDCTRATAHKRLNTLKRRGVLQVKRVREGSCGPKSVLYSIKEARRA